MYIKAQQLLSSEGEDDRCTGIEIIVVDGQNLGIELLATQLEREQSTFVRRRLIASLGAWHSAQTALVAGRLLGSSEAYVRNAALAIMQMLGEVALPVLTELMSHHDCNLRKLAVDALDKIPGDVPCSLLISGLGDGDPNIVSTCAEVLGNRQDVRIVPALTAALASTQNVWVAFAIMESLVKSSDHTILEVIEQYVSKRNWNKEQHIILAGMWAVAASQLGDERQLPVAWELYHDKVLTRGQIIKLLDSFQERGITLEFEQVAIGSLLESFFTDQLKKNAINEVIAAVHIASHHCPSLLDHYLSVLVEDFCTAEAVMEELITVVKGAHQLAEASLPGTGIYKLLSYMYDHDPYFEHRSFILQQPEIFQNDHYTETWNWLVETLGESDRTLQRTAIRGMCRMGTAGRHYLEELYDFQIDNDGKIAQLIRQELEYEWGPKR